MKYLWYNKAFWFFIIFSVLYYNLAPFVNAIMGRHESMTSMYWSPLIFILVSLFSVALFMTIRYYPNSNISLFVFRVKKVFKIIFISLFGLSLTSFTFLLNFVFASIVEENSESFQAGIKYINQDTSITNKIGEITSYDINSKSNYNSAYATYHCTLNGTKNKAFVEVQMIRDSCWHVDSIKYKIK